jgi:hypothetical protein
VRAEAELRARFAGALGLAPAADVTGPATLAAAYPVSDLAAASIATAGDALLALLDALGSPAPAAVVSRPLADAWFGLAVTGVGWSPPPPWDSIAGDYCGADGWVRLHTNAAHHRAAALRVLGVPAAREAVRAEVLRWPVEELQEAVVVEGGCAAAMRAPGEWAAHPQGRAVAAEPLVAVSSRPAAPPSPPATINWAPRRDRPLAGLRLLDLTRVLAGPAATRLLAGLGASVLRIDPPWWAEPALEPEMTLGKRPARLDVRTSEGRARLLDLLAGADVLVHGYRGGALDGLGLSPAERDEVRPGLVDVSLTAYGTTGPWAGRRGFDSLVQMASGIAAAGLLDGTASAPTPLPVQALDHATGYLMAATVLTGLARRVRTGEGTRAVLSLARTAVELEGARGFERAAVEARPSLPDAPLETFWGPARVLAPPLSVEGVPIAWDVPPAPLGSAAAAW